MLFIHIQPWGGFFYISPDAMVLPMVLLQIPEGDYDM